MAFSLPTFNLGVNIWHAGAIPPVGAPAVVTTGNLTPGRRSQAPELSFAGVAGTRMDMFLLMPPLTDVRSKTFWPAGGVVEVPAGSGRYYIVEAVDDVAKGFANEYRMAILVLAATPVPMP